MIAPIMLNSELPVPECVFQRLYRLAWHNYRQCVGCVRHRKDSRKTLLLPTAIPPLEAPGA